MLLAQGPGIAGLSMEIEAVVSSGEFQPAGMALAARNSGDSSMHQREAA